VRPPRLAIAALVLVCAGAPAARGQLGQGVSVPIPQPILSDWARETATDRAMRRKATMAIQEEKEQALDQEVEAYLVRERMCNDLRIAIIGANHPLEAAHTAYLDCLAGK
jgi:hypothetical protein